MVSSSHNITELKENEVFVFGSNEGGRHGKGAAKQAKKWGAKNGQGSGLMGKTYGIPTKNKNLEVLGLGKILNYVNEFKWFAAHHPELQFLVTAIGTGLAGYSAKQIAPMFFNDLPKNVHLPRCFLDVRDELIAEQKKSK